MKSIFRDAVPHDAGTAPVLRRSASRGCGRQRALARTVLRPFFIRMGFDRFIVLVVLLQFMASLPIKMVLRWTLNLKYIVYIPEIFFNI